MPGGIQHCISILSTSPSLTCLPKTHFPNSQRPHASSSPRFFVATLLRPHADSAQRLPSAAEAMKQSNEASRAPENTRGASSHAIPHTATDWRYCACLPGTNFSFVGHSIIGDHIALARLGWGNPGRNRKDGRGRESLVRHAESRCIGSGQ